MTDLDPCYQSSPYRSETNADRVARRIADAEAGDFNSARDVVLRGIDEAIRILLVQSKHDSEWFKAYADSLDRLQAARDVVPEER